MSRATRRANAEAQLRELERLFLVDLIAALRECAAGRWGIFGQNDPVIEEQPATFRSALASDAGLALTGTGDKIRRLRRQLGNAEAFLPLERYEHYRQMRSPTSPGEPRLAVQLLAELEKFVSYSG